MIPEEIPMDSMRRKFLQSIAFLSTTVTVIGAGLLAPGRAVASYLTDAFAATDTSAALKAAFGSDIHTASADIKVRAPDIAENAAVVPVTVSSTLPNIESIAIIAKNNPFPLTSTYRLQNGAEPFISTRLKLISTTDIIGIVKSNGQLYSAKKEVKVTEGGCGG